jgi:two-component system, NarL family, response regulator LiaR
MIRSFLYRHRQTVFYGCILGVLLLIMRWLEWKLMIIHHAFELYAVALAIIFTCLGIWLALKLSKPRVRTVIVEKEVYISRPEHLAPLAPLAPFSPDEKQRDKLGLSKRELEVLQLMATGMSNQEIAAELFLSLNTVKTHISGLFMKLDVKRRTQAVETARNRGIIA